MRTVNPLGIFASASLDTAGIRSTGRYANRTWSLNIVTARFQLNLASMYRPVESQIQPDRPNLLTPCCRVLLEKLTGLQLVKKFPAFHGTRRFITSLTSVRHLSLSWASPIQAIYPHPTSWRSILILPTHQHLGLPSGFLPSGFPTKTLYTPSPHPYVPHAQPISFFSILSHAQYWVRSANHLAFPHIFYVVTQILQLIQSIQTCL